MTDTKRTTPAPDGATPDRGCPSWCVADHGFDEVAHTEDPDDNLWYHRSADIFEIPTADGATPVSLELLEGLTDGLGGGLRVNFEGFDMPAEHLPTLIADLQALLGHQALSGRPPL